MRYEIGKKYVGVTEVFTQEGFAPFYIPWANRLTELRFVIIECIEHHKVVWDQDPDGKKENDGFVFKLVWSNYGVKEGVIFYNQYPHASYGQVSTENDSRFHAGHLTLEDHMSGGMGTGDSDEWLDAMDQAFVTLLFSGISDATEILNRIDRGIKHFTATGDTYNAHMLTVQLQELSTKIYNCCAHEVVPVERRKGIWHHKINAVHELYGSLDSRQVAELVQAKIDEARTSIPA